MKDEASMIDEVMTREKEGGVEWEVADMPEETLVLVKEDHTGEESGTIKLCIFARQCWNNQGCDVKEHLEENRVTLKDRVDNVG